jgi:hypothetical protein
MQISVYTIIHDIMLLYMTNNPTNLGASIFLTLETTNMFFAFDLIVN